MSTTEEQQQTASQNGGDAAQAGDSGAKKALKVGALAAGAGAAAYAASKAMGSRGEGGGGDNGAPREKGGRVSVEQLVAAIGSARWDVIKELVVPFAESGANSAGAYLAKEGPDFLTESLVPQFIEGFNGARGERSKES